MSNTSLTVLTTAQFRTLVLNSTKGLLADIDSSDFISYLNQALANKYESLIVDVPSVYRGEATLTFTTSSFTIDLPDDAKLDRTILIYDDENFIAPTLPRQIVKTEGELLRFVTEQPSGQQYFIKYDKRESFYADGDDIAEIKDSRVFHYLSEEIKSLAIEALEEGEPTAASQNALAKSNAIS